MLKLVAASAASYALAGCRILGWENVKYRFRISVEIDTPLGLRVGSSVVEVVTDVSYGRHDRVSGDAVSVDLPSGQTLFVLLDGAGDFAIFALDPQGLDKPLVEQFDVRNGGKDWLNDYLRELVKHRQLVELPHYTREKEHYEKGKVVAGPPSIWPPMVRFSNPHDQSTIEQVDPDHLDAAFGKGIRLKRITFQITDDAVTRGVENKLPPYEQRFTRLKSFVPSPGPYGRLIGINTFILGTR